MHFSRGDPSYQPRKIKVLDTLFQTRLICLHISVIRRKVFDVSLGGEFWERQYHDPVSCIGRLLFDNHDVHGYT